MTLQVLSKRVLMAVLLSGFCLSGAFANAEYGQNYGSYRPQAANQSSQQAPSQQTARTGQEEIIAAQQSGRGLDFVEVQNAVIVQILPDDTHGSEHQKWIVQLANGSTLLAVYNSSICDRIPLKVGEPVTMAGQYIWDRGGGLIHWLHNDPRQRRPDGYVDFNGTRYGIVDPARNEQQGRRR